MPTFETPLPTLSLLDNKVTFVSGGAKLSGILAEPRDGGRSIVIMCHGSPGNKDASKYANLAKELRDIGIASLRFDFAGHGESNGGAYYFDDKIGRSNLKSAVDYVSAMGYALNQIGIVGSSVGARIALKYAAGTPGLGALVFRAIVTDGRSWEHAEKIKTPTMFICGSKDGVVSLEEEKQFFKAFTCQKELSVIKGGRHRCSDPKHVAQFVSMSTQWLKQNLPART